MFMNECELPNEIYFKDCSCSYELGRNNVGKVTDRLVYLINMV